MMIYKFTVEAMRERFMERPLHDVSEHYIAAYSYEQAHDHVVKMLTRAGWKIKKITEKNTFLQDIRDECDRVTY